MCKCTPNVRTPFCGKPGCEEPEQERVTKPVFQSRHTCEAMQFRCSSRQIINGDELRRWIHGHAPNAMVALEIPIGTSERPFLCLATDRSTSVVFDGGWIISIGDGQFAGMDQEQFAKEYQPCSDPVCAFNLRPFETEVLEFMRDAPDDSRMIMAGQSGGFLHFMIVPERAARESS